MKGAIMPTLPPHEDANAGGWDDHPPEYLIRTIGQTRLHTTSCTHAQTLEAYSAAYGCTVWIPLPCKRWTCRPCAENKIHQLAGKTHRAKPNRLLTLTIDPALWPDPRAAFDGTRRKIPDLSRRLRQRFSEFEYLRVTELTKGGWPHYHMLVRSPYIPHAVVKAQWNQLTGATIVDIRQVKQHFVAYRYLVKYLAKMSEIGWTERHVSYSRRFFPDPEPKPDSALQLQEPQVLATHPGTYLYHQFRGCKLVEIAWNVFAIAPDQDTLDRARSTSPLRYTHKECDKCEQSKKSSPTSSRSTPKSTPSLFPL